MNINQIISILKENKINYIFLDKSLFTQEQINSLKKSYSIIIGQGENARIKISW